MDKFNIGWGNEDYPVSHRDPSLLDVIPQGAFSCVFFDLVTYVWVIPGGFAIQRKTIEKVERWYGKSPKGSRVFWEDALGPFPNRWNSIPAEEYARDLACWTAEYIKRTHVPRVA